MNARLGLIILGTLFLTIFISEYECKPLQNEIIDNRLITSITDLNDKGPEQGLTHYFRKALMDAGHVIDTIINKGKLKLMELPYDWVT